MVTKTSGVHSMATQDDVVRGVVDKELESVWVIRNFRETEFYSDFVSNSVKGLVGDL
jgi:hypothetical protein